MKPPNYWRCQIKKTYENIITQVVSQCNADKIVINSYLQR